MCSRRRCCRSRFELGADVVVYSATKHIDGQGRCLGGVILASQAFIEENIHNFLRQTGPAMSPFNAWVMLKGLETLPLRVAQQTASAGEIADFLAEQKGVAAGALSLPHGSSAGRAGAPADDGRRHAGQLRPEGGKAAAFRSPMRWRSSRSPTISATPRASSPIRRRRRISA